MMVQTGGDADGVSKVNDVLQLSINILLVADAEKRVFPFFLQSMLGFVLNKCVPNQLRGHLMINLQIRDFTPCPDNGVCDWTETTTPLQAGRWYASNQQLPDGTQIIVGGRATTTVEYVPANGRSQTQLPLLVEVGSSVFPPALSSPNCRNGLTT